MTDEIFVLDCVSCRQVRARERRGYLPTINRKLNVREPDRIDLLRAVYRSAGQNV